MIVISPLSGFTEDAQAAMVASPAYFDFWDRWKSLGLVVAIAFATYQLGKASR